jgi:hypothetical protein
VILNWYGGNSRCKREKKLYRHVIKGVSLYGGTIDHMCVLPYMCVVLGVVGDHGIGDL